MTQQQIHREADLIAKAAIYHALKMVKEGPVRPVPKDNMDRWLRGRRVS